MTIWNSGEIYANKDFTEEALEILRDKATHIYPDYLPRVDEDSWVIDEYIASSIGDEIQEMIDLLAPLGYVFDGEVEYYGDFDGKIYVTNNTIKDVDVKDIGLYDATDEELIQILEIRGYEVRKRR